MMGATDVLWHLLNLFALPCMAGLLAACGARLLWRRELKGRPLLGLCAWPALAACTVAVVGALCLGRDGRMLTWLAMVPTMALALWWAGFRRTPRR